MVMILQEMLEKCNKLGIEEKRSISDEYVELVFYSKEVDKWQRILTDILGPAIKPPGVKPAQNDLDLTKDYGSIYENQTLFKKEFSNVTVIAMFWPWQDGTHTTLKVALWKNWNKPNKTS